MSQVQVMTGPERRRRWSDEQRQALVAKAFAPGAVVQEVARRADVSSSLLYRWRRELRGDSQGFVPVVVSAATTAVGSVIELEVGDRLRLRLPLATPPELAAALAKAVARP
jgi:transposase